MRIYSFVMTFQQIFYGAILAVCNHRIWSCKGVCGVTINKGRHFVCLINCAGGYLYGGNDLMEGINGPVGFILEFGFPPPMTDNGGASGSVTEICRALTPPLGLSFSSSLFSSSL